MTAYLLIYELYPSPIVLNRKDYKTLTGYVILSMLCIFNFPGLCVTSFKLAYFSDRDAICLRHGWDQYPARTFWIPRGEFLFLYHI